MSYPTASGQNSKPDEIQEQKLYELQFAEHSGTRRQNDELLLDRLKEIKTAEDIESLQRFAKAYLGMYFDVDNHILPSRRISILANEQLASAIDTGIKHSLSLDRFDDINDIARSLIDDKPLDLGFVILAAINMQCETSLDSVLELPDRVLEVAICFHFANPSEATDQWFDIVLSNKPELVATTLIHFWTELIQGGLEYVPGLNLFLDNNNYRQISSLIIPTLLKNWRSPPRKTLRKLLVTGIMLCEHKQLIEICTQALQQWNPGEPAKYILWLASAYMLQPAQYEDTLVVYCGRSKEKILPLLDFSYMVFSHPEARQNTLPAEHISTLIRIIAAKITPQYDGYGHLCANTQKLMYLFYQLAKTVDSENMSVIDRLNKVRVMKLYIDILSFIQQYHTSLNSTTFESFIEKLISQNLIKIRSNRFISRQH